MRRAIHVLKAIVVNGVLSIAYFNGLYDFLSSPMSTREVQEFFLPTILGEGEDRVVYAHPTDSKLAIKFDKTEGTRANVTEKLIYENLPELYKPFFAKVGDISLNRRFLIQERTMPPLKYPEFILAVFADTKLENFGVTADGRFVCHDFAVCNAMQPGKILSDRLKIKKAHWWSLKQEKLTGEDYYKEGSFYGYHNCSS